MADAFVAIDAMNNAIELAVSRTDSDVALKMANSENASAQAPHNSCSAITLYEVRIIVRVAQCIVEVIDGESVVGA